MLQNLLQAGKEICWLLIGFLPIKAGGVILAYHSVADNGAFFTVTPQTFEQHLKFLRTNKWNVVPLMTLVDLVTEQKPIPSKTVVVTFDDAYVDFLDSALPLLEKYQIPATVFVPTGLVGARMKNREGYELAILDWSKLQQLAAHPLITIGSHTKTHPVLTEVTDMEALHTELWESKKELEDKLGISCDFFAYPKGKNNATVQAEVEKVYTAAVGTRPGRVEKGKADVFSLCRQGVYRYTSLVKFKFLLKR